MSKGMGIGAGIGLGIVGVVLLVLAVLQHSRIISIHVSHLATYVAVLGVIAIAAGVWLALSGRQQAA